MWSRPTEFVHRSRTVRFVLIWMYMLLCAFLFCSGDWRLSASILFRYEHRMGKWVGPEIGEGTTFFYGICCDFGCWGICLLWWCVCVSCLFVHCLWSLVLSCRRSRRVARCLETIVVCIWRMFVFMSVVMTVWGSVGMFVV